MEPLEPLGHPETSRKQMRALAHPVRMRILELLAQSPSTATHLAREMGESTGSTSYHLRALAKVDLIEEDTDRGSGRERWWQRRPPAFIQVPTGAEDAEGRALETQMWGDMVSRDDEALARFFAQTGTCGSRRRKRSVSRSGSRRWWSAIATRPRVSGRPRTASSSASAGFPGSSDRSACLIAATHFVVAERDARA